MWCSICETDVSERALFCEVCGNRVRRPAAESRRAPAYAGAAHTNTATRAAPSAPVIQREELAAAVATRTELGERMEPEVLDAFLARIEQAVVMRIDQQIEARMRGRTRRRAGERSRQTASLPVAICSLIFGIPISGIAGDAAGLAGLIVAWLGIAAINFAVAESSKEQDGRA